MGSYSFRSVVSACLLAVHLIWASAAHSQNTATETSQTNLSEIIAAMEAAQDPETTVEEMGIIVVALTAKELGQVADAWKNHLRTHLEETMRINIEIERAGPEYTGLRDELVSLTDRTREMLNIYSVILTSWQRKGGDEPSIEQHRSYVNALQWELLRELDLLTVLGLLMGWLVSWQGGLRLLVYLLALSFSVWAMFFVARFVSRLAGRNLEKVDGVSDLLSSFLLKAVYWSTFVFGVAMVLVSFGVNITPAFAVFGGVSFVLGFAMQETLGNFASGLLLMVHKPFDTGDYVKAAGYIGFVDRMSIVSTKVRTLDHQVVTIPNSKIWADVITNFTATDIRRVDLVFGIGYSDNVALAIEELRKIIDEHPKCLKEPAAEVFVGELGESSVNIFCRPWVKPKDYLKVSWDLTGQAKERFDAAGISIPFPQRDIHIRET